MSDESAAFHAFEQAGWSERGVVDAYERSLTRLTTQSITALLDAVHATRGTRLLDVATGPGHVALAAQERGAVVRAVDFSPEMVARALARGVEAREGDAHALPFADATFDAVVCNYGMLHFADPERALAEAARLLVPGGRVAFTVWSKPDRAVGLSAAQTAVQQHGDPSAAGLPVGPPFFRFSDPDECVRTMESIGLEDCRVTEVPQTWRLGSVDELLRALEEGTVRNRSLIRAQPPDARKRIDAAITEALATYRGEGGRLEIPMPAVLASGARP